MKLKLRGFHVRRSEVRTKGHRDLVLNPKRNVGDFAAQIASSLLCMSEVLVMPSKYRQYWYYYI